jgi:integrase/recombinase XerD
MRDLIKDYLSYVQVEKGLSQNTLDGYLRDLRSLERFAQKAGKEVGELSKGDLTAWVKHQAVEGASPGSIARRVSSVKGFYNYLLRDGIITIAPHTDLSSPSLPKKIPTYLQVEEVDALLGVLDSRSQTGIRDRAIIELLYATGVRVSELVNLKVNDLSLERALLTCRGKGSKQRCIPLGRSAVASLRDYLSVRTILLGDRVSELLLLQKNGAGMTRQDVWLLLRKYAERAGLERVSPHSFRHTFASHLIQRGADSRAVQALLGHSDLSTTQIYTHVSNQHLVRALEEFHPREKIKNRR